MTISAYVIPGIKECDREDLYSVDSKIARIVAKIGAYYNLTDKQIRSKSRRREVVIARQFCMYFIRINMNVSLKYIGELFGGRDHTTSIHSINFIKSQLSIPIENSVKSDYEKLIQII